MPITKNHPVENRVGIENMMLTNLMPLLERSRKLEEDSRKFPVLWIVVNGSEPNEHKPVLPKPL